MLNDSANGFIDPEQFVISRRRKKYRFAKFSNAPNCFELDEWLAKQRDVAVLEIGAGTGFFSVELAARHPEQTFVALDVKADRLQRGAYAALERGLGNVLFVRAPAYRLAELFAAATLQQIWVTFPDPFPRARSAGRRLTHPTYLAAYAGLLRAGGELRLKHDNLEFFQWSLEQLVATGWRLDELAFDLHGDEALAGSDAAILTSYEQRWLGEGRVTRYVSARR